MTTQYFTEPSRQIPISQTVDVVVVGGGTAGCIAAIAAARLGVSVVLIERFATLGGCATTGRCFHIGNHIFDRNQRQVLDGLPVEVIKRVAAKGGTHYDNLKDIALGKKITPMFFLMDPEILTLVLMEMIEEAGIHLMLLTYYCEPIMQDEITIIGVIAQNKSGRFAVMAKCIIDASGEADVAFQAGVPCESQGYPDWLLTYGLLMRLGNVNHSKFMNYFLSLPAGEPRPEFDEWLPKQVGKSIKRLRRDWYWKYMLDPQPGGWGVPSADPEKSLFNADTLAWFRERWETEKDFAYVGIHFFRDLIKKAVDNGDFELIPKVEGIGEIGYNWDGLSGGEWRKGEVIVNIVNPRPGFDAFNTEHISKMEIAARKRAHELQRFFKKYLPGFEDCNLIDTGAQTMPRHIRFANNDSGLGEYELMGIEKFDDVVFMAPFEMSPSGSRQIPYRILLPSRVENLIIAGKCVVGSVSIRGIPLMMAMGQASGVAAALASKSQISPKLLKIKEIQKNLLTQNVILSLD